MIKLIDQDHNNYMCTTVGINRSPLILDHLVELNVMIAGGVFVVILAAIGLKALSKWLKQDASKWEHDKIQSYESRIKTLESDNTHLNNSRRGYKQKLDRLRYSFEFDYDDILFEEEENEEFKISDIAKAAYPQLPDSISKLIDKEEFQNAIIKTIDKKPDILNTFIEKFIGKKDQGSTSNSAPKLVDTYL